MDPLSKVVCGADAILEVALYSRPPSNALLQQLRREFASGLALLDDSKAEAVAKRWADEMSTPEHTHSGTGRKLSDGWNAADAMAILQPLATLAMQRHDKTEMYLLIEW